MGQSIIKSVRKIFSQSGGAGGVTGSGTINYVAKFTAAGVIGDSQIFNNGTGVSIGTATPIANTLFTLKGTSAAAGDYAQKIVNVSDVNLFSVENNGKVLIQTLRAGLGNSNIATNTAFGVSSLDINTTGERNTAIGYGTLSTITTESDNTALGYGSLVSASAGGANNTSVGSRAMGSNTSGGENTGVGFRAGNNDLVSMQNSIGRYNTWVGFRASSVGVAGVSDSEYTTVVGHNTTVGATGGVALGAGALISGSTSINSLALGRSTTASATNAVALGYNTTASQANSVILGNGCDVGVGTATPKSKMHVVGLPTYADNAAAVAGGLTAGAFYIRTGHGLDVTV